MFKNINIVELLEKERLVFEEESDQLVDQALEILNETYFEDLIISEKMNGSIQDQSYSDFLGLVNLEANLVYSSEVIENICTKYRLRFLDSELYAGEIPYEATIKLKSLRKKSGIEFKKFKILAPESKFKLKDSKEDPVLFAQIDTNRFYMIHKWGEDLAWYKKIMYYPMRNTQSLAITSIVLGLFTTLLLPESIYAGFVKDNFFVELVVKLNLVFVISGGVFVSFIITGIMRAKEFSQDIWNSKYFD